MALEENSLHRNQVEIVNVYIKLKTNPSKIQCEPKIDPCGTRQVILQFWGILLFIETNTFQTVQDILATVPLLAQFVILSIESTV